MTIEQRIRKLAKGKVKASVTKKRRSKGGFAVLFPGASTGMSGGMVVCGIRYELKKVPTFKQAQVELLTAMRMFPKFEFSIKPVKKGSK